eukprot:365346-Chlamydomonas_euryale.AAC.16
MLAAVAPRVRRAACLHIIRVLRHAHTTAAAATAALALPLFARRCAGVNVRPPVVALLRVALQLVCLACCARVE